MSSTDIAVLVTACLAGGLGIFAGYRVGYGKGRVDGTIIALKEMRRGDD